MGAVRDAPNWPPPKASIAELFLEDHPSGCEGSPNHLSLADLEPYEDGGAISSKR